MHEYAIRGAAAEYERGHYRHLFRTGGPIIGKGGYIIDFFTSASVAADLVKRAGIPGEAVQMVPSRVMERDRTYGSAVALRKWLDEHHLRVTAVNIVTESCHARRTRLLFQKALGPDVTIGTIAISNPDYDATHWWRYSEGVEEVIGETIAYIYAKFFFYP